MSFDNMIKVTFLGDVNTGKSSIIQRFVEGDFKQSSPTIGASNQTKSIQHLGREFVFSIWDTAGQERYRSISKMLYRDAKAVVLVFDLACKASFEALDSWYASVKETSSQNVVVVIAGNKTDAMNLEVKLEDAVKYADRLNLPIFFVSAKTGESIGLIFEKIGESLVDRGQSMVKGLKTVGDKSSFHLSEANVQGKKKKKCC